MCSVLFTLIIKVKNSLSFILLSQCRLWIYSSECSLEFSLIRRFVCFFHLLNKRLMTFNPYIIICYNFFLITALNAIVLIQSFFSFISFLSAALFICTARSPLFSYHMTRTVYIACVPSAARWILWTISFLDWLLMFFVLFWWAILIIIHFSSFKWIKEGVS